MLYVIYTSIVYLCHNLSVICHSPSIVHSCHSLSVICHKASIVYLCHNISVIWVIIKKHALFCYYAIKRQISTKLIGENMFCMKAHQLSIVLSSKSRLVQLRIYTSYTKTCFFPWCYVLFFQNDLLLVICTIQML